MEQKEKVLIVDDEEATRLRLKKIVEKEGLKVLLAEDGAQALEVFTREKPGIVVTDLKMPRIDAQTGMVKPMITARPAFI